MIYCCRIARLLAWASRRSIATVLVVLLNAIHPLLHGTPLDAGALDVLLPTLTGWAASGPDDQ